VAVADALREIVGSGLDLSGVALHGISFSPAGRKSDLAGLNGINAEFTQVDFSGVNLEQAKFAGVALDACVFRNANLAGADFSNALLIDCDLTDTRVQDTNFQGLYPDSNALLGSRIGAVGEVTILEGEALRGYLKAQGASVDPVDDYWVYAQHPKFTVIEKICRVLSDGAGHQRRGVEQRGEAGADIALARAFVDSLIKQGLVAAKGRGGAAAPIGATPQGRGVLLQLADRHQLPHELVEFLRRFLG
jgi:uncharacterized protein YjbI with pentapeptide repeats